MNTSLAYSNLASKEILSKMRDINFALDNLLNGGSRNFISRDLTVVLDLIQITLQGDIFRKYALSNGSKLYLKKIFGNERGDWGTQLLETFVYDRLRCMFYGYKDTQIRNLPNVKCFKGHAILRDMIARSNFRFSDGSNNKLIISVTVKLEDDFEERLNNALDAYPKLKVGLDWKRGVWHNEIYEGFLEGLNDESISFNSNSDYTVEEKLTMYEMCALDKETMVSQVVKETANPILNSYLNREGSKFSFIYPGNKGSDNSIQWNESVFYARAVGIRAVSMEYLGNSMYTSVGRVDCDDVLTRYDVHAITGCRTEAIPLSLDELNTMIGNTTYYTGIDRVHLNCGKYGNVPSDIDSDSEDKEGGQIVNP
jgi:hypothetical protein